MPWSESLVPGMALRFGPANYWLTEELARMRKVADTTADVDLICRDGVVSLHQTVLALGLCQQFRTSFSPLAADDWRMSVILPDASVAEAASLLDLLYTGQAEVSDAAILRGLEALAQLLGFWAPVSQVPEESPPMPSPSRSAVPLRRDEERPPGEPTELARPRPRNRPRRAGPAATSSRGRSGAAEGGYLCSVCGIRFGSLDRCRSHQTVHGERRLACPDCGELFRQRSVLHQHRKIRHGPRRFSCRICSKEFSTKQNVEHHRLVHTGEAPHSCSACGTAFRRLHHLRKHLESQAHRDRVARGKATPGGPVEEAHGPRVLLPDPLDMPTGNVVPDPDMSQYCLIDGENHFPSQAEDSNEEFLVMFELPEDAEFIF